MFGVQYPNRVLLSGQKAVCIVAHSVGNTSYVFLLEQKQGCIK
jgi:hypothetical protein